MSIAITNDLLVTLRLLHEWSNNHIMVMQRTIEEFPNCIVEAIEGRRRMFRLQVEFDLGGANIASASFTINMGEEFEYWQNGNKEVDRMFKYTRDVHWVKFENITDDGLVNMYDNSSVVCRESELLRRTQQGEYAQRATNIKSVLILIIRSARQKAKREAVLLAEAEGILKQFDPAKRDLYMELYKNFRDEVGHSRALSLLETTALVFKDIK